MTSKSWNVWQARLVSTTARPVFRRKVGIRTSMCGIRRLFHARLSRGSRAERPQHHGQLDLDRIIEMTWIEADQRGNLVEPVRQGVAVNRQLCRRLARGEIVLE